MKGILLLIGIGLAAVPSSTFAQDVGPTKPSQGVPEIDAAYAKHLINQLYWAWLFRKADGIGLGNFVPLAVNKQYLGIQAIARHIGNSNEAKALYSKKSANDFILNAYQYLFYRAPNEQELQAYLTLFSQGKGPSVLELMVKSNEYYKLHIEEHT